LSLIQPVNGPTAPPVGPLIAAICAVGLACFFIRQGRIMLLRGAIERSEQPLLYWSLLAALLGLAGMLVVVAGRL
jgi:hypothetical protein